MFWDLCCSVGFGRHPMAPLATRWTARANQSQQRHQTAHRIHAISNQIEAAYRRGDLFEKRRKLMGSWAVYLAQRE